MSSLAITSAMDPRIEMFDDSIPRSKHLEDSELFKKRKQLRMTDSTGPESRALTSLLKRPKYSMPLAYTLSVASKLVYEEVEIIKYELKRAGFDVDRTFKPIAYKVCILCYTDQLKFTTYIVEHLCLHH